MGVEPETRSLDDVRSVRIASVTFVTAIDALFIAQSVDFEFLSRVTNGCTRADSDVEFWADHSSDEEDDDEDDEYDSEEEGVEFEFEQEDRQVSGCF